MQFDILNRHSGEVQFTAEIEADENASISLKVGLAVRWGKYNGAYLRHANLRHADLRGAYLRDANLRHANLRGADLRDADLRDADLSHANLRHANLQGADLRGADLWHADLRGADLRGADLQGANLQGADLLVLGQRSDGYMHIALKSKGKISIQAGCRQFTTLKKARDHWSKHERGKDCLLCKESLLMMDQAERLAELHGWFVKSEQEPTS